MQTMQESVLIVKVTWVLAALVANFPAETSKSDQESSLYVSA